MIEANITLFNINLWIRYQIFDDNYIDWQIITVKMTNDDEHISTQITNCLQLLTEILRMNHSAYIESVLREHYHWHMEAEARAYPPDESPF